MQARAGASWVGFSAAAEADDGGVLSEWGEVEYTKRDEAWNIFIAFVNNDSHNFQVVLEEIGNGECVLHEETEVGVGTPFRGVQLDKWRT